MNYRNFLYFFIAFFACIRVTAQVTPIIRAHAHNDYMHEHPLKDALSFGFTSVEADIFLIDGGLYVSHERPQKSEAITLQKLYLKPLQHLMQINHGKIYPNYNGVFYLMIDIKNDSLNTYNTLKRELALYPEFNNNPYFKIYLTSFENLHFVLEDPDTITGIDGRLGDLNKGYSIKQMPVISEPFKKITEWNGRDSLTDTQYDAVRLFILKVHQDGKKCRLWAIPDNPVMWKRLLDYGMDFINTDKLKDFSFFLNLYSYNKRSQENQKLYR